MAAARRASSVVRLLLSRDDIFGGTDARGFLGGVDGAEAGEGPGPGLGLGLGFGFEPRV